MNKQTSTNRVPWTAYGVAWAVGIFALLVAAYLPLTWSSPLLKLVTHGMTYLIGGVVLALVWPSVTWRWGLWMFAPLAALIGFSVLFSGFGGAFLTKDLPLLFAVLAGGCLGGLIGARLSPRSRARSEGD